MTICIIPARGASKRIPKKNIKLFHGKPIIEYVINAASKSNLFTDIIVSTDCEDIAAIARNAGATTPFKRSEKNSSDTATTAAVLDEVLEQLKDPITPNTNICCIYPTAVFVTSDVLIESFSQWQKSKLDGLVTVVPYGFPIQRAVKILDGKMVMFHPEHMQTRSQDLEKSYHDCGQFYWLNVEAFRKEKKLYLNNTYPFIMSELETQDIDTLVDWEMAELKYLFLKNKAIH
jgi:N-acylneuraminate cytidylyltransferase